MVHSPAADTAQLPTAAELQDHIDSSSLQPSTGPGSMTESSAAAERSEQLREQSSSAEPASELLATPHVSASRFSSYKSPMELLSAPSSGKVTIAGRRLATGELVPPEVIHLHDFAPTGASTDAGGTALDLNDTPTSPSTPVTPGPAAHATSATGSGPSDSPRTIQETTKTAEQVYVTHAAVAAAAAAAGGLVGGAQLDVRTAANVAEAAVDPAAVVDSDSITPTAAAATSSAAAADTTAPHTPTASAGGMCPPAAPQAQQQHQPLQSSNPSETAEGHGSQLHQQPQSLVASIVAAGAQDSSTSSGSAAGGSSEVVGESIAGHAVLPEDRQEVAATLQRLRAEGQVQGPFAADTDSAGAAAAGAASTEDIFIGAGAEASSNRHEHASQASGAPSGAAAAGAAAGSHPSGQSVSAGTAAPAKAGYPEPAPGTAAEMPAASGSTGMQGGMERSAGSSSGLVAMHDVTARAAAVAGALVHIGQPVTAAAALADTATQPAAAVEAAAAAAAASAPSDSYAESSPATSTAARAGSLHQQHTLADFLLDEPATAAVSALSGGSSSVDAAAGSHSHHIDLSLGTAAADEDLQVQLDVGRSTRLLSPDGRVAAAAATVPQEAVAAIQADLLEPTARSSSSSTSNTATFAATKTPQHPSLRQLSLAHQAGQQAKPAGELPYGLTVADIVAATVASEERRFRVVSPRGSPGGNHTPRSAGHDNFFSASSGSSPSTPQDVAGSIPIDRSSSPMSAAATRAIFDSVQLAVQQQQQQEQLALGVARAASLGPVHGAAGEGVTGAAAAPRATTAASTAAQMESSGSGDSTATSNRSSQASLTVEPDPSADAEHEAEPSVPSVQSGEGLGSAGSGRHTSQTVLSTADNAEVMQQMLLQEVARAADKLPGAAVGETAAGDTLSTDSNASQCGDSDAYKSFSSAVSFEMSSGPSSSNVSTGDKLAAAVAASRADAVGAAASGTDVASTAAPAFAAVLFGPAPLPVDVPAEPRSDPSSVIADVGSSAGQEPAETAPRADPVAAALTSSGMEALDDSAAPASSVEATPAEAALQQVVDATSTAVIATAGLNGPAVAAATAAAAATEMHADAPDPAVAAADAAQLVVDAANTVPGLLEPADVASAAAAAGAAAAAAATPGMDATTAAIASAAAAASPLSDPVDVGAAAAQAILLADSSTTASGASASASEPTAASVLVSAGQPPSFAPVPTAIEPPAQAPLDVSNMASALESDSATAPPAGSDLGRLLPILAPSGHVGDTLPVLVSTAQETVVLPAPGVSSGTCSSSRSTDSTQSPPAAATGGAGVRAATGSAPLQTVPETAEVEGSSGGNSPASKGGQRVTLPGVAGTAEMLNTEGLCQSHMFDPLVVQLALASSAPLEGLGLDESILLHTTEVAGDQADRAASRSSSMQQSASGTLMMHPHPLSGTGTLAAATSLGPASAEPSGTEGSVIYKHLDAAAEALSKLDSKLQRQRTDSISLGGGQSSAPGDLDAALAAMAAAAAAVAEAPAGALDDVPTGVSTPQV